MRKLFLFVTTFLGVSVLAQNVEKHPALDNQFGLEVSLFSVGASYELPLSHNILMELSSGFSAHNLNDSYSLNLRPFEYNPFSKVLFRRYYNRDNRFRKGKEINNNRGNFIGIDSKFFYTTPSNESARLVSTLHWGVQTELANQLLLTFDFGVGHWYNPNKEHFFFPTIGLKVKYILF